MPRVNTLHRFFNHKNIKNSFKSSNDYARISILYSRQIHA